MRVDDVKSSESEPDQKEAPPNSANKENGAFSEEASVKKRGRGTTDKRAKSKFKSRNTTENEV